LPHQYEDLIYIFNTCFAAHFNTRLLKGGEEPVYIPAHEGTPYHAIYFAHGFFSSALHECAHWLIAGEARRKQVDFGYWYLPDGRNAEQQIQFERAEVKPQALEWILSKACGYRFNVSVDNLNGSSTDALAFKNAVLEQVHQYCEQGLSGRMAQFRLALCDFYQQPSELLAAQFELDALSPW
jgi:elongation factor P hydroxylase